MVVALFPMSQYFRTLDSILKIVTVHRKLCSRRCQKVESAVFEQFEALIGMNIRLDDNDLKLETSEFSKTAPSICWHRRVQSFRCTCTVTIFKYRIQCLKVFAHWKQRNNYANY